MIKKIIKKLWFCGQSCVRRDTRGFTLIEVLIAMTIFVSFTGILINSYMGLVRSQRDANEYRMLYSEARHVFDKLTDEIKNGSIFYDSIDVDDFSLIGKDGVSVTRFSYNDSTGQICFTRTDELSYFLNSDEVKIIDFNVFVTPLVDPYLDENVSKDYVQFQPKVTIFARFSKELNSGKVYEMDLHTTISSRTYGPGPDADSVSIPEPSCNTGGSALNPLEY